MISKKREKLIELIASNSDIVDFGCSKNAVDSLWVDKAENTLGLKFTPSYRWFLNHYAGGEICGEEIFSVYGIDFEHACGGDIVYQHIINIKNQLTTDKKLVVSETDYGEVFYFDYSAFEDNECPINVRLPSGVEKQYASDFYDFLMMRIQAYL